MPEKTTLTERILFYTGKSQKMGDVHHGITQMNTDPSERKHEIAVNSAATTISWNEPSLCLIDTPGHIDFNIEVKRPLRVLNATRPVSFEATEENFTWLLEHIASEMAPAEGWAAAGA